MHNYCKMQRVEMSVNKCLQTIPVADCKLLKNACLRLKHCVLSAYTKTAIEYLEAGLEMGEGLLFH